MSFNLLPSNKTGLLSRCATQQGRVLMPARIPNSSGSHFSNLAMLTTSAPRTANFPRAQGRGRQQVTRATASVDESEPIVDEVMVPHPIIFKDSMSVKEAARILMEKDISGAPVVDETGKLVGVLSESDIMWKGAGAPQEHFIIHPIFIGAFDAMVYLRDNKAIEEELHKLLAKTVGEAMSKKVVSIKSDVLMSDAAKLMLSKKVNRLPVVDDDNKVVGVITRHDVLRGMLACKSPFLS